MEVFIWYVANEDGSDVNLQDFSGYVELPQFLIDVVTFVEPLYSLLSPNRDSVDILVFDKIVYSDPRLHKPSKWDGTDLEEIKRVNPALLALLAAIPLEQTESIAEQWFSAGGVGDFLMEPGYSGRVETEAEGVEYLRKLLSDVSSLAKKAILAKKCVMERFWWCNA